jgi:hypothetical protein
MSGVGMRCHLLVVLAEDLETEAADVAVQETRKGLGSVLFLALGEAGETRNVQMDLQSEGLLNFLLHLNYRLLLSQKIMACLLTSLRTLNHNRTKLLSVPFIKKRGRNGTESQ